MLLERKLPPLKHQNQQRLLCLSPGKQSRMYRFIDLVVEGGFVNIFLAQLRLSMALLILPFFPKQKTIPVFVWEV